MRFLPVSVSWGALSESAWEDLHEFVRSGQSEHRIRPILEQGPLERKVIFLVKMGFAQEPHVQFASDQDVPLSFSCIGQTRESLGMFYVSSIVRLQVKPAHRDEWGQGGRQTQVDNFEGVGTRTFSSGQGLQSRVFFPEGQAFVIPLL